MDGLNLKFAIDPLEGNFDFDSNGALISKTENLRMEKVADKLSRELKADNGLYRRLTDMYFKTDVEFTDNPFGNTPTCGAGAKRYGKRPLLIKNRARTNKQLGRTPQITRALEKREAKIVQDQKDYMKAIADLEPTEKQGTAYVQWLTEKEQVMTGGGFDGNSIGEVHKSALKFVSKGNKKIEFANTRLSAIIVAGALRLCQKFEEAGLRKGSLKPIGCSAVRMEQDNDGLIGFPVYSKGYAELTPDIALRILIDSGVDTRPFVGQSVVDERTGESCTYRVIDACGYMLDHTVISDPSDAPSIVTLLARIQKHAWKLEDNGDLVPKKSKTRSVYPNAAKAGLIEAMIISPFNDKLKEIGFKHIPSIQDKPTRVRMLRELISEAHLEDYECLPLDESQYDATVVGDILATIMYYAVRPFYSAQYYSWIDFAIYCLCYKYILCDTSLCSVNPEEFEEAKKSGPWVEVKPFTIFGMTDGLISGAKFTHVGGSCYGLVTIHDAMPILLDYKPKLGAQAGDDCAMFYPRARVYPDSAEKTFGPIEEAAAALKLEINKLKQIFIIIDGEMVCVFLQDDYHEASDTWGIGSIFRPLSAVFFSERNKGLSIAEQYMAEIARMNQGADSYYAEAGVREWLMREEFIGLLFKEYGVNAFNIIVESIGDSIEDITKRIDVGSFTFGVDRKDLEKGTLPILPIIAKVAGEIQYTKSLAEALKSIGEQSRETKDDIMTSAFDEGLPDIGDSDDVRAD